MKFNQYLKKCVRKISRYVFEYGLPNPKKFEIIRTLVINDYLIMRIYYSSCNNFDGNKILVFDKGVTLDNLWDQERIDPRFSDDIEFHHPIARFTPDAKGWNMAVKLTRVLN